MEKRLYVTPWSLFSYEECPLRYSLQKQRHPSFAPKDERNAFGGALVHSCWENFIKLGKTSPEDLIDLFEPTLAVFERHAVLLWDSSQEREEAVANALQSLRNSIDIVKQAGWWYPEDMRAEYQLTPPSEFDVQGRAFLVGGRVDCLVVRPNNEVAVLDWKDVRSESTINYAQLGIYQYALEARGFTVVESAFVLTQLNKFSEKLLQRRGRREKLDQRLVKYFDGVISKDFHADPSVYHCRWCRYGDECNEKFTHEAELKSIEEQLGGSVRGELDW